MTSKPHQLNTYIQGQGFPILCLHGHPGSGSSMSVFTQNLSQRFKTVSPDLRGYGKSRFQGNFVMQDHLIDLEALLDRLEIEKCLILGWSLGGILAMELALKLPERVTGLILIATAARPRGSHPPVSLQDNLFTAIASIINQIQPSWQWNIDNFGKKSLYRYLVQQHTSDTYRYLASDAMSAFLQTSPAAHSALNNALKAGYNRLEALEHIQVPCLMLAGSEDRHITAASSLETAQHLKNCQWQCYPNTAHLFPWEIPQQMNRDIETWLAAHPQVIK
ncbi:alpha/beta fold hydrolase [Synechocystis sp. PCC 7509]|uniref:alpha/beta fold hydrolase n=1 Tax=Synechocystis sp. PCC 7509 TaxID=927677 RepID=UPI001D0D1269|nr:alpha/beta hydrolase [Synechocystis sp. PCC 7509]